MEAIQEFHLNQKILQELQATFFVLIPKGEGAKRMEEFCPISLYNVKYKILAKVLANRLKKIIPSITSQNQDDFV